MVVKVKRAELREGEKKDGTPYLGTSVIVIFNDKQTAARLFLPEDVIDPNEVEIGQCYDLYRDDKGNALVFDKLEAPPQAAN